MRLGIRLFAGFCFLALLTWVALRFIDKPGAPKIPRAHPISPITSKTPALPQALVFIHACPALNEGRSGRMLVVADPGEWLICPVCKEKITDHTAADNLYEAIFLSPQKQLELDVRKVYTEKRSLSGSVDLEARVILDGELYKAQANFLESLTQVQAGGEWAKNRVESARLQLKLMGLEESWIDEIAKLPSADKTLIEIRSGGPAWVYADVDEDLAESLENNESLWLRLPGSAKGYPAVLRSADEKSDPAQRKRKLRVSVPQGGDFLKAEQPVILSVPARFGELVAVDEGSIFNQGSRNHVFIDRGQGLFEKRAVVLGRAAGGFVEIRSGLLEGDRILAQPSKLGIEIPSRQD